MCLLRFEKNFLTIGHVCFRFENSWLAIELRFENNFLTNEGVRFTSIEENIIIETFVRFRFASLPLLLNRINFSHVCLK